MKRLSKLALLLLVLIVSVLVAVSCGGNDTVDGLAIKEGGMPQTVFVLGEKIDLSNGLLTVTDEDTTTDIPMDADGVTVSGYDKDKLGEQTVTISYGGKSTELKVTVVERMIVVNQTTDYLVGDTLDLTKGSIKVTRNDGTNYTVKLDNANITVEGFDSSAAGSVTMNVNYETGVELFKTTYNVTVHAVDEIKFNKPNKVAYDSHDGGDLDLSGGYITLKGNGGTLERDIQLTSEDVTVSGFNLSVVNKDNPSATQKITVNYGGKSFEYEIRLTYTDVSMFLDNCDAFLEFDWTADELPTISEEVGALAFELMELYLDISKADKTYITDEQALAVARTALIHGLESIDAIVLSLGDAFTVSAGELTLTCASYEAVEEAVAALEDTDNAIYAYTPVLAGIIEAFAEYEVIPDYFFGDFGVIEIEVYEQLVERFEHMLELSDTLDVIPDDWQAQGVENFADDIENVWSAIEDAGYTDSYSMQMYYYVSYWRTNNDMFDMLYEYYYGINDTETLADLALYGLPTALNDVYYYVATAIEQMYQISQSMLTDTTQLLYSYYYGLELAEGIKNGNDEMAKNLYATLPLNRMLGMDESEDFTFDALFEYIRTTEGGVQHCAGALLGVAEYDTILAKYIDIIIKLFEDESYDGSAEYGDDVEELFALYVALTPATQFNFLVSLSPYYAMGYPPQIFDDSGEYGDMLSNIFVTIINDYYRSKFTSNKALAAYNDFVIAMELYAQRGLYDTWADDFKARMDAVADMYPTMSEADQAKFTLYLGDAYDKYAAYRASLDASVEIDLGEWQDEFDALEEAVQSVELAYSLLSQGYNEYNLLFSAYERAQSIAKNILMNAHSDIVNAYYHEDLYVAEYESGTMELTYDYILNSYRSVYISSLLMLHDTNNVYDVYMEQGMGQFLDIAYDLIWKYMLYADDDTTTLEIDREKAIAVMEQFSNLTDDQQTMFIIMEGDSGFYYLVLNYFVEEAFTANAAEVVYKLISLEQQLLMYKTLNDEESFETLRTMYEEIQPLYAGLEGDDRASFEALNATYNKVMEKCEETITAAENPQPDDSGSEAQ